MFVRIVKFKPDSLSRILSKEKWDEFAKTLGNGDRYGRIQIALLRSVWKEGGDYVDRKWKCSRQEHVATLVSFTLDKKGRGTVNRSADAKMAAARMSEADLLRYWRQRLLRQADERIDKATQEPDLRRSLKLRVRELMAPYWPES